MKAYLLFGKASDSAYRAIDISENPFSDNCYLVNFSEVVDLSDIFNYEYANTDVNRPKGLYPYNITEEVLGFVDKKVKNFSYTCIKGYKPGVCYNTYIDGVLSHKNIKINGNNS